MSKAHSNDFKNSDSSNIKVIKHYSVEEFNTELDLSLATVDIAFHHVEGTNVKWENLTQQIYFAKNVFNNAGVQLHVSSARLIKIPDEWMHIDSTLPLGKPKDFQDNLDFYDEIRQKKNSLSKAAKKVFSAIIENTSKNSNIVHVISLKDVKLSFYEKNSQEKWELLSVSTGALSFPSYILEERIDRHLRGVVTIQSDKREATLAHELGHKLINVSHEGLDCCPKFSGDNIPGLLGYAGEGQIYSGAEGRWHRERLHLSPYIYKVINSEKAWNPDYKASGRYDDPIYGHFIIKPSCPEKS